MKRGLFITQQSLLILFSPFVFFISCNTQVTKKPIVDLPTDRAYYENASSLKAIFEKQHQQTIILQGSKKISFEKLENLGNSDKIKSLNVIKDSAKITALGLDYSEVKTVLLVERKSPFRK